MPSRGRPWGAWPAVAFLMLAYTAGYAFSAPHTDTADELLRAYGIRHALAFPAEGPFLGQAIHLGPFWFYLVAAPLFVHPSWLAAALFIGFVCSLQFPLAYWCGRQLVDERFGLLWAAAMFFPGWTSVQQLAFLNPNAVAAAVLGLLALTLWALRRPATAWTFAGMGLAMGLALHVHPTAMPAYLLALAFVPRQTRAIGPGRALLAMAAGFALPFLPYVVSQAMHGFPDRQSATAYVGGQVALANVVNTPLVAGNYLVSGPRLIAEYFLGWGRAAAWTGWGFAALASASLLAFLDRPAFAPLRRHLPAFIAAFAILTAWIAFLRPTTPVQFTWVLGPVAAALVASALWCLSRWAGTRYVAAAIVAAMVAVNVATLRALALAVRDGDGRMPSSALDIKQPTAQPVTDVWFPAWAHAPLGDLLCAKRDGVSAHGHLAHIVDQDLGLDSLFTCAQRDHVRLGGAAPGPHYAGMTRAFWRAWGAKPACWIGSLGIVPVAPDARSPGIPIADGSKYLPRRGPTVAATEVTIRVTVPAASAVLVTNILGRYELFEVLAADGDGVARAPVASNELSQLFAAPTPMEWTIRVRTTYPEALDVVVVPGGAAGAGTTAGAGAGDAACAAIQPAASQPA